MDKAMVPAPRTGNPRPNPRPAPAAALASGAGRDAPRGGARLAEVVVGGDRLRAGGCGVVVCRCRGGKQRNKGPAVGVRHESGESTLQPDPTCQMGEGRSWQKHRDGTF